MMFSMWGEIEKFPEFKHLFFVPCDSHGLQLFVIDLLKTPRFENIIHQARCLVSAFKKAPLQYARLRKLQSDCYGHEQSLVLSVIMRWGTQYRLLQSILKNKDALKRYACDYEEFPVSQRIKQPAIGTIRSTMFWHELELLREVLQPIDECLKMSESGKSHLGHVLNCWMDLLKHLEVKKREIGDLETFISNSTFVQCFTHQVLPIHVVAYYLMPLTTLRDIRNPDRANATIPLNFEQQIAGFFRRYTFSEDDAKVLIREFTCFRSQRPPFESARLCWEESEDVKLFWDFAAGYTTFLSPLAIRIFSAPVNSVASE